MSNADQIDKSDIDDFVRWEIPVVEDTNRTTEDKPTNALNKRSDWKYEPPEKDEEVRPPTAEEIEAIRQAAYDEGLAQGKEEGHAEGFEEGKSEGFEQGLKEGQEQGSQSGFETGKAEVDALIEQWQSMVEQLHQPLHKLDDEAKRQLTKLSVTLAKAVIHTEAKTNHDVIVSAVEKGINALPINETQIQILLNQSDIDVIEQHFGQDKIKERGWEIVPSASITQGGCEVVSHNNAVDVSVEKRCRTVLETFLLNHGLSDE
ncbi:flagellar assembly protein FliH [Alteromonas sediminis]|uniref:Flagellar assembly protein FliH n=1 Tax=Alteromonas sediminis TaxID=2259342 RepID=A0A3N5XWH7_9ALTE|nr:flagellar assembly protein FliH [Alteromonas sediminis]RPJ65002.1 flagellar assembly protein FliH [Alteromonas sediminis]